MEREGIVVGLTPAVDIRLLNVVLRAYQSQTRRCHGSVGLILPSLPDLFNGKHADTSSLTGNPADMLSNGGLPRLAFGQRTTYCTDVHGSI